jgi:hypothetical protein
VTPDHPAFATGFLIPELLHGTAVGLTLPALGTMSAEDVPSELYGIGAATNAAARQLGAMLGIAAVVAVVGTPRAGEAADTLRGGWAVALVCLVAAGAWSLRLQSTRRTIAGAAIRSAAATQYGRGT